MTRTPDSNTEKLNELYKQRVFLKTKLSLQEETYQKTLKEAHYKAIFQTNYELSQNELEIDKLLDADL